MQTTKKDTEVIEGEDLNEPLSVGFLRLIHKAAVDSSLIKLALKEMHPGVKEMLSKQGDQFLLGFVNCAQYLHDTATVLLVDPISNKYKPNEELSKIDSQTIRLVSIIDASAYYCVQLLADRGYLTIDDETN